jgi:V/A-type H+-transporting ATPase subunit I
MMFGDVGHGACLFLIGLAATLLKKGGFLAKILAMCGASSVLFGFMYGAYFGFETDNPLWITPMKSGVTIIAFTIGIGAVTIMLSMIFNIINGIKQRDFQKCLFSQNGLAGLLFYLTMIAGVFEIMRWRNQTLGLEMLAAGAFVLLPIMLFQAPLGRLLSGRKRRGEKERSALVESFFELIESLLGYVNNTMSFVRIGAFALSHAGIMSVVLLFMAKFRALSIPIAIFGNLFVIGFEGLIVGIQVLRLGFYEIFSRFYSGDGAEFRPSGAQN